MSITQLTAKYLYAILPNEDFELIANINEYREVSEPQIEEVSIRTEQFKRSIDYPLRSQKHRVQTQLYELRKIFIDINENQKIDLFKHVDSLVVENDEGEIYDANVIDAEYNEFKGVWKWEGVLQLKKLVNDELAISNYLIQQYILDSENGQFAATELNRLILTVNPDWINARSNGTEYFPTGKNFSSDNKDFRILDTAATGFTVTITADAASHSDIVTSINSALAAASPSAVTFVEAFDGGSFIGLVSTTGDSSDEFELKNGISDDALAFFGWTEDTYENAVPLDETFDDESNTMTFYTKLMPYFFQTQEENETVLVDGIQLPVYKNSFLTLVLDFYLDSYIARYGTLTESQAFDYYVSNVWYVDDNGNAAGQEIDIENTTQYNAIESLQIEKIDNDDLIGVEQRRITVKYAQLQNYSYRIVE